MFREAFKFITRYKYAAAIFALIGLLAMAGLGLMRIVSDPHGHFAVSGTPLQPVPIQTASAIFPTVQALQNTEKQLESLPHLTSESLPFQYTACPPEMKWFPNIEMPSGYTPVEQPVRQRLGEIKQISVGYVFDGAGYGSEYGSSYALKEDGTVYRWGVTEWGNKSRPNGFPQKVSGLTEPAVQLEGRFALLKSGEIYDINAEKGPRKIEGLPIASSLAQAVDSSVYVTGRDGSLWLYSLFGSDSIPTITKIDGLNNISSIKASPFITLALDKEGKLRLAKSPFDNLLTNETLTLALPEGVKARQIETTMSNDFPAFVLSDRGDWFLINGERQIEPVNVQQAFLQMTASQNTVIALKADGTVWAWGESSNLLQTEGQRIEPDHARQIDGLTDIKTIAAGTDHLLALTNDGYVLTMGSNMYGQLGRLPIYAADPQPFGTWPDVDAMFLFEDRLLAVTHGDLWVLSYEGAAKPVVLDQNITKAFGALGHFAALTADGRLLVADSEDFKPCRVLQADGPIVDASSVTGGVMIAMSDGRVFLVEGNLHELDRAKELSFKPTPEGKAARVFGSPIPFVLTDKGELYYNQRIENGFIIMEKVEIPAAVKQWSPIHYVYFDGIGYIGKVLDEDNQVYDLELKLIHQADEIGQTASIKLSPTGRHASSLTGGAEINKEGHIYEQGSSVPIDTHLPASIRLGDAASLYHYFIEGRTYFYHFFATENGTLYWLGDWPHSGPQKEPGYASFP